MTRRIAHAASFVAVVLALALVPAAIAAKGGHGGGGGGTSCTQNAPTVAVQNNWQWGNSGSWGLPGQQIAYMILLDNTDSGCGSSTFTLNVTAPSGFSVSVPTSTVSLGSGSYAYLWAYVTSPVGVADGDYTLTVSAARTNGPSASAATAYKLYSSDTTAPTLFWPNPGDGTAISGRSYNVSVSSSDDHAVKKITSTSTARMSPRRRATTSPISASSTTAGRQAPASTRPRSSPTTGWATSARSR